MHHDETSRFAVVYIPFYALQSARQKRMLERSALDGKPLDQLSFEGIETDISGFGEGCKTDDASANLPAALLDPDGVHVLELNPAAEQAGIQPGMSTSQAIARAPELLLYRRSPSNEEQLQQTLLQLVYRYSPLIENSAPGICTLDLKGKRIGNISHGCANYWHNFEQSVSKRRPVLVLTRRSRFSGEDCRPDPGDL